MPLILLEKQKRHPINPNSNRNSRQQPTAQTTQQFKRKLAQGLEKTVLKRTDNFIDRIMISRNRKNKFAHSYKRNYQ